MNVFTRLLFGLAFIACVVGYSAKSYFAGPVAVHVERGPKCPVISDVSTRPLGELSFDGETEKSRNGAFDDDYLKDHDGKIKVGIREQWGGALVFFGDEDGHPGSNASNTLDDSDLRRGLQLAFHDDARGSQGCAYNSSCTRDSAKPCVPPEEFLGWNPVQGGNICGEMSGVEDVSFNDGMRTTSMPLNFNPGWGQRGCAETTASCANPKFKGVKSPLRISQSVRFVKSRILEVDVQVTNLSAQSWSAGPKNPHEFPALYVNPGKDGAAGLVVLKNANGNALEADKRAPASGERIVREISTPQGWAAYQSANADHGVGIYWENRSEVARAEQNKGASLSLSSGFPFTLPPFETVRGRFYLLLGGYDTIKSLAQNLDKTLPPFGRIDTHRIEDDTRTVTVSGWVLDNKGIAGLELWVDGKKISDVPINTQRDDICAIYPGYSMCTNSQYRIGFSTTYTRPEGTGCDRPVEIRAHDGDGNLRVIARKSISPVEY